MTSVHITVFMPPIIVKIIPTADVTKITIVKDQSVITAITSENKYITMSKYSRDRMINNELHIILTYFDFHLRSKYSLMLSSLSG